MPCLGFMLPLYLDYSRVALGLRKIKWRQWKGKFLKFLGNFWIWFRFWGVYWSHLKFSFHHLVRLTFNIWLLTNIAWAQWACVTALYNNSLINLSFSPSSFEDSEIDFSIDFVRHESRQILKTCHDTWRGCDKRSFEEKKSREVENRFCVSHHTLLWVYALSCIMNGQRRRELRRQLGVLKLSPLSKLFMKIPPKVRV